MTKKIYSVILPLILLAVFTGFDFSRHSIPLSEIRSGGPPKDGIPALYDPSFISAREAHVLRPTDRILGLFMEGEAKAYPIAILNWHELVNDRVGEKYVLVSYCPLCGTGMAFDARIDEKRFLFGVSGKLYNSNVLFYDQQTESLWSQIRMEAVTGPMTGKRLKLLPLEHTTWHAWRAKYPQTKVLSQETGYKRDYARNSYQGYAANERILFPVAHRDSRLPNKVWILGVVINGEAKAYPFETLEKIAPPVKDRVGGEAIFIQYDPRNRSALVRNGHGKLIPSVQAYWFAWVAFHPDTKLFE